MSWFRRNKDRASIASDVESPPKEVGNVEEAASDSPESESGKGPWDVEQRPELGERIDLGAVRVPARDGMTLRLGVEGNPQRVVAVNITLGGSELEIRAFAAPRSEGIWEDIREEISASVTKQGGTADDLLGPFGREVLARVPIRTSEGRTGHRPARFIGLDGPRWFLRGVLTGQAAMETEAAAELESVFAETVVVRGTEARVPRDLLTLTMPGPAESDQVTDSLDPFERGPEITEVQ